MGEERKVATAVRAAEGLVAQGRHAEAEDRCRRVLIEEGPNARLLHLLALAVHAQGRTDEAVTHLEQAARENPADGEILYNLGVMLASRDRLDEAMAAWSKAREAAPGHPGATENLALALMKRRHWDEARPLAEEAATATPRESRHAARLGHIHANLGDPAAARRWYRRAVDLAPDDVNTLYALGLVERDLGDAAAAQCCQERVVGLAPAFADGHFELAAALLAQGKLRRGFAEYEWRLLRPVTRARTFPSLPWDGCQLAGRRLLVYGEQGMGDTIQFARFIAPLAARGAQVTLACHEPLVALLAGVEGVSRAVALFHEPADVDLHVPIMSLAHRLDVTLETLPGPIPYIPVPKRPVAEALGNESGLKVGIVWSGGSLFVDNVRRSPGLEPFRRLAAIEGVRLFSLQMGEARAEISRLAPPSIIDLAPRISDLADTAALLARLDLVVSVDTVVAHLAGAMGRPVWLTLAHVADWRWPTDRDSSPWYPTARLFRQPRPGDWAGCLARVADELDAAVRGRPVIPGHGRA